jgi:hypothetical protein
MARPYDLRHPGVTRRLNEGMPQASVAAWAGHSVEVLTRMIIRQVTDRARTAPNGAARCRILPDDDDAQIEISAGQDPIDAGHAERPQ